MTAAAVGATAATRSRTDPRGRAILAVLVAMAIMASLQSSVVVPLVAHIPGIFGVSAAQASWIVTSTMLGASVAAPIVSRLADLVGKRRVVVATLLVVGLGSLLVAVSNVFLVAVLGRTMQGFAMSLTPVAMSIIRDVLPRDRVGFGVALLSGTMSLGTALGLPFAGLLYWLWGWHALFWVTAVLAPCLAVASWRLLPASAPVVRQHFDALGAVLLVGALIPLLLVISQGEDWGWTSSRVPLLAGLAVVCGLAWVGWERRAPVPLVDLRLAVRREVAFTNAATLIIAGGMLANMYLTSQQLGVPRGVPGGLGLSSGMVGLAMVGPAAVLIVMSPGLGPLLTRLGGRTVLLAGALVMAAAYVARIWLDGSSVAVVIGAMLVGVGIAMGFCAQPLIIMSSVPPDYASSANGINALFRTVGTSISIAAIAALTSATSTRLGGAEYPTLRTFHLAFGTCAVLLVVGAGLVLRIPRRTSQRDLADA